MGIVVVGSVAYDTVEAGNTTATEALGGSARIGGDDAGILARSLDHLRPYGRKTLQKGAGALVGTMLAPHHRKNSELGEVWFASQNFLDALEFLGGRLMRSREAGPFWCTAEC